MSDWLVPLAAAAIAVIGSLGGVALTQRHQLRISREERRAQDRNDVREILTRLIRLSNEWVSIMEIQTLMISKMTDTDLSEFVDTDSGRRWREVSSGLNATFGEAALRIADPPILEAFAAAFELYRDAPEKVLGKVLPSRDRPTGDAQFERTREALKHVWAFGRATARLEAVAAGYVRTEIGPIPTP